MERLVTTSQAAEILGLSLQGIHYRIKKDQLKSIKKDGKTFVYISDELKNSIVAKVRTTGSTGVEIETKINEALIGGFTLEVGGKLIDASILRDLQDVGKQFKNNEFIHNIR